MKIKIINTYHDTEEIVEAESLEKAIANHESGLEYTANNLAENEIEDDWVDYYKTEEEAFNATYDLILEQLKSEIEYTVIG